MSTSNSPKNERELEEFEDALVNSILEASESETRDAIAAAGEDPAKIVKQFDDVLASARAACGILRLQNARIQVEQFAARWRPVADAEREAARVSFASARFELSQGPQQLMMAARNGQGATERDLDSLLNDLAELERLEREQGADK